MMLHVVMLDIILLVDLILFGSGIALVIGFKKLPHVLRTPYAQALLSILKVLAGGAILTMLIFKIDFYTLIGSGIDMILSFIAGVLLGSGILLKETDIL